MSRKKLSFDDSLVGSVKDELDHRLYRKLGKKAKVKGVQTGEESLVGVLETHYFKADAESDETISNLVNRYYWKALEDKKYRDTVTQPDSRAERASKDREGLFFFSVNFRSRAFRGASRIYIGQWNWKVRNPSSFRKKMLRRDLQEIRQMFATMEDVSDARPCGPCPAIS